ncbi:DUF6541 family protein [Pseudarthrobacter sp. MM222]|uniref:DUF6541 family protein n=1 Tax=Pseudarthrobacter sp. MM222 TaxID=3018929 RepID=UPI00221E9311|nr:DUF6541 family protein [Pseudarthrobacter sp. MM222]CAI3801100.1 hypothetical protein NKCBBBOE_02755 [Pseudarthrobacter sp. MM222]
MSWLQTLPFVLAAVLFLLLPGGLVTASLGLRGLPAAALAAPVTVSIASVLAVLMPFAGLPWSAAAVLVGGILLSALSLAFRRAKEGTSLRGSFADLLPRPGTRAGNGRPRTAGWVAAAFAAGAGLILIELALAFVTPDSISQTFDNVFHLNGVRYILDTGSASSLTMSKMTSGDAAPYFYPAAWHGLAAALIQLTGLPIAVAVNVLNMAIAAVVWPLGCMLLTRTVAGNRPVAVGAAGILSAMFAAFPILLLDFGVLYPNFLAISMLPAALASVALLFRVARELEWPPLPRFVLPVLIIPGLALAHPNGFMSLVILAVPIALQAYVQTYLGPGNQRRGHRTQWILATSGLAAGAAALYVLWSLVRPPEDAAFWPPPQTPRGAVLDLLTNGAVDRPAAAGVSVLMLLGLFLCWRRGGRTWMLAGFVITAVLYVIVSGTLKGDVRSALTGVWYNDSNRIAALLPLTALPFAAVAVDTLAVWLRRTADRLAGSRRAGTARRPVGSRGRIAFGIIGGVLVAVFVGAQVPSMRTAIGSAQKAYRVTDHSLLVTAAEQRVIDRLDEIVPEDAAIAVNPWTGGALAYALAHRETTAKHILTANTADVETLNQKLRDADHDPAVCAALAATGVRYVLDFGANEVHFGKHPFPGLQNLNNSLAVRLVLSDGPARLYEVTACR